MREALDAVVAVAVMGQRSALAGFMPYEAMGFCVPFYGHP
jgi:hypothetical protein